MPRLSGIYQPDVVEYSATLGSESVTVKFDQAKMNMREELEVAKARDEGNIERVIEGIVRLFVSWDVADDYGAPVPLTSELLFNLPSRAVISLFEGMREAATPPSEEGNASDDTSSIPAPDSTVQQGNHLNGPTPSTLPLSSTSPFPT